MKRKYPIDSRYYNFQGDDWFVMAERKGFEPSVACATHAFQACSFDHSDTSLYVRS